MVSLNNNYSSEGHHTIVENQSELPFIYFKGKTTQPAYKKNDLNIPERYNFAEIINKISVKSDYSNTSDDSSKIIYTEESYFNKDEIKEKINIYEDANNTGAFEREHFHLPMVIYQGTNKGYKKWISNNNLIFAPASNCIA